MVSPGTHLVKNIESQSRNIESQIKQIYKSVIENAWAFVYPGPSCSKLGYDNPGLV